MRYAYCIAPGCKCLHRAGVPAEEVGEGREDYEYRDEPASPITEIPDDCLPPQHVIDELLRGPKLDDHGRIIGGVWDGLTPAEVLRGRDEYNRLCGE